VTGSAAGPLVDADALAAGISGDPPPTLLDVRWQLGGPPGRDSYLVGHLPGAVYADLDTDLAGPPGRGGRHPLPDVATAQHALRRLGVSDDRPVVVYDDQDGSVAARAWWVLRWLGHRDVRLLDGGLRAWQSAGMPVEAGDVTATVGDFTARPGGLPVLDAEAAAQTAQVGLLLDVRAAERYRGEVEPVDPVAGHVPGAVSAPTTANVDDAGRFHAPAELRARFERLGVRPDAPVGAYCGSGVNAAHTVLALEVAGLLGSSAALYAGSWSEWVTDPTRPVARG
jgi:thiosulfate/3-mercaptopyruvate sulfurtransferase